MPNSPEPSAREQLLAIQRATFDRLQEDLRARRAKKESEELRRYQRRYDREIRSYRRISSKAELLDQVVASEIVYCGDFHTLFQAQRTPIRILRSILRKRPKIILALEMLAKTGEKVANAYLSGQITEEAFLDFTSYRERWGFPWTHYRQLFDFAREQSIRVLGLNTDLGDRIPLEARDDLAADFIVEATLADPEALLFCLYGDLHISEPNIPKRVDLRLKKHGVRRRRLIIFQNSEPIYWDLSEKGLAESVDVVEIGSRKFCVLSAAPWTKWQSYLSWLEDQSELLADGVTDEAEDDETEDKSQPDYYHQVFDVAQQIADFFRLTPGDLDHFSVYTANDVAIIDELKKYCAASHQKNVPIEEIIRAEVVENRSAYFPEASILYLNDLSANRAAEKASQILASKAVPGQWLFLPGLDEREIFYRLILWEAIGFLGSKIINPKRKCDQYKDFEESLAASRGRRLKGHLADRKIVAGYVLAHWAYEQKRLQSGNASGIPRSLFRLPPRRFFLAASAIGQILAHRLYTAMVRDNVEIGKVALIFGSFEAVRDAASRRYFELASLSGWKARANQSKEDHF